MKTLPHQIISASLPGAMACFCLFFLVAGIQAQRPREIPMPEGKIPEEIQTNPVEKEQLQTMLKHLADSGYEAAVVARPQPCSGATWGR